MMIREKEKLLDSEMSARKELSSNKMHNHEKVASLEKSVSNDTNIIVCEVCVKKEVIWKLACDLAKHG